MILLRAAVEIGNYHPAVRWNTDICVRGEEQSVSSRRIARWDRNSRDKFEHIVRVYSTQVFSKRAPRHARRQTNCRGSSPRLLKTVVCTALSRAVRTARWRYSCGHSPIPCACGPSDTERLQSADRLAKINPHNFVIAGLIMAKLQVVFIGGLALPSARTPTSGWSSSTSRIRAVSSTTNIFDR